MISGSCWSTDQVRSS